MPSKPVNGEQAMSGIAAMQALHAVVEIAGRREGDDGDLYSAFAALSNIIGSQHPAIQRGFSLSLMRLLYYGVQLLKANVLTGINSMIPVTPEKPRTPAEALQALEDVVGAQEPDVQLAARRAYSAATLHDFVRVIDYGVSDSMSALVLAQAAALVVRHVVTQHGTDPVDRWALLGVLTGPVVAAQFE